MRTPPDQPTRFQEFLLDFLRNPLFCLLGWSIKLVLYPLCWLGIQLHHIIRRFAPHSSLLADEPISNFDTKWEIKQAVKTKDADWLTSISSTFVWYAIGLGAFGILIVQWPRFPITTPLVLIAIPVFLAWCSGWITGTYRWRVGLFCILAGILGGFAAIRWPLQNLSKHHWDWVIALIAGGGFLLWQYWKKPTSTNLDEQK